MIDDVEIVLAFILGLAVGLAVYAFWTLISEYLQEHWRKR